MRRLRRRAGRGGARLAAIGVFDFVGTILSGWLSDRYDNRWLLFVYYGLRGLSLISLPFTDFSVVGLSAFAVFYGLDWVATVPPTVRLTAERFGAEKANVDLRLDLRRPSARRRDGGLRRGALAQRAFELPARLLRGGRDVPRRLRHRLADPAHAGGDFGAGRGAGCLRTRLRLAPHNVAASRPTSAMTPLRASSPAGDSA